MASHPKPDRRETTRAGASARPVLGPRARWSAIPILALIPAGLLAAGPAAAQIDPDRAGRYFREAETLCRAENGRLWKTSLCGPMLFVEAATREIAANRPTPAPKLAGDLPIANTAIEWGGTRWTMLVWQMVPQDEHARARLMLHELWHRIQPDLGFEARESQTDHLDTAEGRYWIELEWRALAEALGATGADRRTALRDALAFRVTRRRLALTAAEGERALEMNEGLAAYTGVAASSAVSAEARAAALDALAQGSREDSFVRTFAYASGPAYGVLLDELSPGWTRLLKPSDDLGQFFMAMTAIAPGDARTAAERYGGPELLAAEQARERVRRERTAELRRTLVQGSVLVLPVAQLRFSFDPRGIMALPGAGTVYSTLRASTEWGILDVAGGAVLLSPARDRLVVAAPARPVGRSLSGPNWKLTIENGWSVQPGARAGDWTVARDPADQP